MQRLFNLNSLTDIISNAIGIAILLALVTFITSVSRVYEVVVPLAHETALTPRFFVVQGGAILPIDRGEILREVGQRTEPFEMRLASGASAAIEVTDDAGFLVRTRGTEGFIPTGELSSLARTGRAPFAALDRDEDFAFLFVYDTAASWHALREARRLFSDRGVRVGWTIVTEEHPPHLCASPMSGACSYRPAMP